MLFLYVSLHNPLMIACLNLPISTDQRSSLWSRRTRHELRDLARLLIVRHLRREQGVETQTDDNRRVTTVRYEDLSDHSVEHWATNGTYHT